MLENLRRERVDSRVDQVALLGALGWFLLKTGNFSVGRRNDDAVLLDFVALHQTNCSDRAFLPVVVQKPVERNVREVVASYDDEGCAAEKMSHLLDRARAPEQFLFMQVFEPYTETRTVAERVLYHLGEIVHVDRDLRDAERLQVPNHVRGIGFAHDRNERFGHLLRQRVKARAQTARENHRPHEFRSSLSRAPGAAAMRERMLSPTTSSTKRGNASCRRQRCGSFNNR